MKNVNEDYLDGYLDAYLIIIETLGTVERFKDMYPEITFEGLINKQLENFKKTGKRPIHNIHRFRNNPEIMEMINLIKELFKK